MARYFSDDGKTYLPKGVANKAENCKVMKDRLHRRYAWREVSDDNAYYVHLEDLTDIELRTLAGYANQTNNKPFAKVCQAVINFEGTIPSFEPAYAMILRYLRKHAPAGWLYLADISRGVRAYAVDDVHQFVPSEKELRNRERKPHVMLAMEATAVSDGGGWRKQVSHHVRVRQKLTLYPSDVTRKKVADVIEDLGLCVETKELRAAYDAQVQYLIDTCYDQYGKQFRMGRTETEPGVKVILDTENSPMDSVRKRHINSPIPEDAEDRFGGVIAVPVHPDVAVFRLDTHDFEVVPCAILTRYVYDPTLADKLILPETHMDMLDVLTTDVDAFMRDIIEGKSAGNIILCKGIPGIGKTLTAEVYSELVGKPIYSVHSGALGTSPDKVEGALRTIFDRVNAWDCIMLLDEADVFVAQRGSDLVQNAIVSVFLRVLEYFGGLMFMTTNRSDNIDDAIVSRCAAIIDYGIPNREDMRAVWEVMAEQQGVTLPEETIAGVLEAFPEATPRDVKHLMRLCLRVATSKGVEPTEALFRQVAQFRAVKIVPPSNPALRRQAPNIRRRRRADSVPTAKVKE